MGQADSTGIPPVQKVNKVGDITYLITTFSIITPSTSIENDKPSILTLGLTPLSLNGQ
jgi:hypothetical protein